MAFIPEVLSSEDKMSLIEEPVGKRWTPLLAHDCSFTPEVFHQVMLNLIRNPNLNSNHLFRADILLDLPYDATSFASSDDVQPRVTQFSGFIVKTIMVRTLIPRNILVDKPMDQTCLIYENRPDQVKDSCQKDDANQQKDLNHVKDSEDTITLVVYRSHISSALEMPFYHPAVDGIGFLHKYNSTTKRGSISIQYLFFDAQPRSEKLDRTAQHLLALLYKHGVGLTSGYLVKNQHDTIIPQAKYQSTYARLKAKYARTLCQGWIEKTDPGKHVFEDLGIAAFLIELWADMYPEGTHPPKFVDIGCGNGLLVHILLEEGYDGWGFDARSRKSWSTWSKKAQANLKELVMIPSFSQKNGHCQNNGHSQNVEHLQREGIHNGVFPKATFIISNHSDELTPWTPILAAVSQSPFIIIPCCSHALSGARFRAAPPKGLGGASAYASLVAWVSDLSAECGWEVEKDMLRIPSTRNVALIGRRRIHSYESGDIKAIIAKNGGCEGWEESALKLVNSVARGH